MTAPVTPEQIAAKMSKAQRQTLAYIASAAAADLATIFDIDNRSGKALFARGLIEPGEPWPESDDFADWNAKSCSFDLIATPLGLAVYAAIALAKGAGMTSPPNPPGAGNQSKGLADGGAL